MGKIGEIVILTKIELVLIKNTEWTKSLLLYFLGLQLIDIILTLFKGPSSAFLGIGFLGVCFMNVFYAPRQFAFNRINPKELTPGQINLRIYIISKLLVLWIFNVFCFIPWLILVFFKFDVEDLNNIFSFFIFCFGFVSPVDILLSSINEKEINKGLNKSSAKYKFVCLAIGIIPLIPFPILLLLKTNQTYALNVFALCGLLMLLFSPLLLRMTERGLFTKKNLFN